jgi:hypothetical protein
MIHHLAFAVVLEVISAIIAAIPIDVVECEILAWRLVKLLDVHPNIINLLTPRNLLDAYCLLVGFLRRSIEFLKFLSFESMLDTTSQCIFVWVYQCSVSFELLFKILVYFIVKFLLVFELPSGDQPH